MKRTSIPNPNAQPSAAATAPNTSLWQKANEPLQLTESFLLRFPEAHSTRLPPALPGSIHDQYKRCGKANCHCHSADGKLHGPYSYLFLRKNGKLIKRYIRSGELDTVILLCAAMKARKQHSRAITEKCNQLKANRKLIKQVFDFSMRVTRPVTPKKEPKQYYDSQYYKGRLIGAPEVKYQWTMSEYPLSDG